MGIVFNLSLAPKSRRKSSRGGRNWSLGYWQGFICRQCRSL